MKRAEIEVKINDLLCDLTTAYGQVADYDDLVSQLTDLFIQLSEERSKDQNKVCMDLYVNYAGIGCYESDVANLILNAPFPTLD